MAEVICSDCGGRADDVVCKSCYDSKVQEIDRLEDEIADKERENKDLQSEVDSLTDKVSDLEQEKEREK